MGNINHSQNYQMRKSVIVIDNIFSTKPRLTQDVYWKYWFN